MAQSAPLQWFTCFLLFLLMLWLVAAKLWFATPRPQFHFPVPNMPTMKPWKWNKSHTT